MLLAIKCGFIPLEVKSEAILNVFSLTFEYLNEPVSVIIAANKQVEISSSNKSIFIDLINS